MQNEQVESNQNQNISKRSENETESIYGETTLLAVEKWYYREQVFRDKHLKEYEEQKWDEQNNKSNQGPE